MDDKINQEYSYTNYLISHYIRGIKDAEALNNLIENIITFNDMLSSRGFTYYYSLFPIIIALLDLWSKPD